MSRSPKARTMQPQRARVLDHGAGDAARYAGRTQSLYVPFTRVDGIDRAKLDLLVADFARVLNCEVALVCELRDDGLAHVISSSGVDDVITVSVSKLGGRRRLEGRFGRGGCFVGRALASGRLAFETLDPDRDARLIAASDVALTCALSVPVLVPHESGSSMLVAGFSRAPHDLGHAFWVADAYARLIALLAVESASLSGLGTARHDGLTGCLTYESLLEELSRELNRSARADLPLSCCFIDLDGFKRVNDLHGHVRGNQILADVGLALRDGVRNCDTVGRYGGDEFITIFPQTREADAALLAERLRSLITSREAERAGVQLSASIGVAEWVPGASTEQLLARADRALYAAKALPGGVATYRPSAGYGSAQAAASSGELALSPAGASRKDSSAVSGSI